MDDGGNTMKVTRRDISGRFAGTRAREIASDSLRGVGRGEGRGK